MRSFFLKPKPGGGGDKARAPAFMQSYSYIYSPPFLYTSCGPPYMNPYTHMSRHVYLHTYISPYVLAPMYTSTPSPGMIFYLSTSLPLYICASMQFSGMPIPPFHQNHYIPSYLYDIQPYLRLYTSPQHPPHFLHT